MALAPYDAEILATVGHLIASLGQWERGVALAKKANELNAEGAVGWYHAAMYYDYYLQGDYERALEFRRLHADQQAMHAYIEYIPVYGQLGRKQDAQENWRKLLADVPGASAETFENWYRLWNMRDEDIAKLDGRRLQVGRARAGGAARAMNPASGLVPRRAYFMRNCNAVM
jgi:tetratricopeptide (TPR) repeat protein